MHLVKEFPTSPTEANISDALSEIIEGEGLQNLSIAAVVDQAAYKAAAVKKILTSATLVKTAYNAGITSLILVFKNLLRLTQLLLMCFYVQGLYQENASVRSQ